tara:strand:+ start:271 stop:561 length:291 start_codon:yes stop_codon:yes gene_type:complete
MRKPEKIDAIIQLVEGPVSYNHNKESVTYHADQTPPTEKAIQDKLKELEDEYEKQAYARSRAKSYDPIPEQLDQIYHDIDGWKAKIKAVKDKYPKP